MENIVKYKYGYLREVVFMKKNSKKNSNKDLVKEKSILDKNTVGYDLFFSKQRVINLKKNISLQLHFNSNIFYKYFKSHDDLYKPSKFIRIKLF